MIEKIELFQMSRGEKRFLYRAYAGKQPGQMKMEKTEG